MNNRSSLKALGEFVLRDCPDSIKKPSDYYCDRDVWYLDVPRFTKEYMHLQREMAYLSPDGSILGATVLIGGMMDLYDHNGAVYTRQFSFDTILLDPRRSATGMFSEHQGRYRFTEMHENSHNLMIRNGFAQQRDSARWFCSSPKDPEEQDADYLAAYLLMPDSVIYALMRTRSYEPFVCYESIMPTGEKRDLILMAQALQVSTQALSRRMHEEGFIQYRSIYEYEDPDNKTNYDPCFITSFCRGFYRKRCAEIGTREHDNNTEDLSPYYS